MQRLASVQRAALRHGVRGIAFTPARLAAAADGGDASKIPISLVKELRERTGTSIAECKNALVAEGGDIDKAIAWLRKKGLASAAKKASRVASDGLVAVRISEDKLRGAIVELNSETDFVARNEAFQATLEQVAGAALAAPRRPRRSGRWATTELIATVGENCQLRRAGRLEVRAGGGAVGAYVHSAARPGMGRMAALVALEAAAGAAAPAEALHELAGRVAMHVVGASPSFVAKDCVAGEAVEREREVATAQARAAGKDEKTAEKIVQGRMAKWMGEVVLSEQKFIMDEKQTVSQLLAAEAKRLGVPGLAVAGFLRYKVGEGIEKAASDLKAEVEKLIK
eukprot:tig00000310_g23984.t1